MTYIKPQDVHSPKRNWSLHQVIIDKGPGSPAYAVGKWDSEKRIGFRWNGTEDNPIGNPQSRGLPTWTILDQDLHACVLHMLDEETRFQAEQYLEISSVTDLKTSLHPSGNITLMRRDSNQRMFHDVKGLMTFPEERHLEFYRKVLALVVSLQHEGKRVFFDEV